MPRSKRRSTKRAAIVGGIAVAVVATLAIGWWALHPSWPGSDAQRTSDRGAAESTGSAEATGLSLPTASNSPTAPASASQPTTATAGPTYTKFAYVRNVGGAPGSYTVTVDFFVLLASPEADAYAAEHGLTVPDNGLLFDNPDENTTKLPVSADCTVRYATGSVEAVTMVPSTMEKLRQWASGDAAAMPDAMTDQWKVTVTGGKVTRIDMLVVAG